MRGDDFEICAGIILQGRRLRYDSGLRLKHAVAAQRLSEGYVRNLYNSLQEDNLILSAYNCLVRMKNEGRPLFCLKNLAHYLLSFGNDEKRRIPRFAVLASLGFKHGMSGTERAVYEVDRHIARGLNS